MDSSIISSILEIDRSAKEKLAEAEDRKNRIIADAKAEQERIIGERVKNRFGSGAEPVYGRLLMFFETLRECGFVEIK